MRERAQEQARAALRWLPSSRASALRAEEAVAGAFAAVIPGREFGSRRAAPQPVVAVVVAGAAVPALVGSADLVAQMAAQIATLMADRERDRAELAAVKAELAKKQNKMPAGTATTRATSDVTVPGGSEVQAQKQRQREKNAAAQRRPSESDAEYAERQHALHRQVDEHDERLKHLERRGRARWIFRLPC